MYCEKDTLKRIVALGLPTGIQSCLYSVSNLLIQTTVNGYGTDTVAAFTAFGKIDALFWMMTV
jgi:Na+-driven multidrug efflux pump